MNQVFVDIVLIVVSFTGGFLIAALMYVGSREE